MVTQSDLHRSEVSRGERFEFGKNWARFLSVLNDDRIKIAERSLVALLQCERLDGLTFLDIGSGSGLFSLVTRRLGAKVHSFDYDPQSVACTRELRRRYFPDDTSWKVEQASVLDKDYLGKLGTFDIVYSWGVLHHTGQMWQALDNVKPLVKMGGKLFIAIYNDLGPVTDNWARVKQTYNGMPAPLALGYALTIIAGQEARSFAGFLRRREPAKWIKSWTEYDKESTRGMSKWHDWIDWIGGHPYERATVEQMVDFYARDGYLLTNIVDRSNGYGCNEFVFRREAPLGTLVDSPIPGGRSIVRRFGRRVMPPFTPVADGYRAVVAQAPSPSDGSKLWLFRSEVLIGPARVDAQAGVSLPRPESGKTVSDYAYHLVAGRVLAPDQPFAHSRGSMWSWEAKDLADRSDSVQDGMRSTVTILQDGRPLDQPHAMHAEIIKHGKGRFSHWGPTVYFATRDNVDPNKIKDRLVLFIPDESGQ